MFSLVKRRRSQMVQTLQYYVSHVTQLHSSIFNLAKRGQLPRRGGLISLRSSRSFLSPIVSIVSIPERTTKEMRKMDFVARVGKRLRARRQRNRPTRRQKIEREREQLEEEASSELAVVYGGNQWKRERGRRERERERERERATITYFCGGTCTHCLPFSQ